MNSRTKQTMLWTAFAAVVVETITLAIRFGGGVSATEFNGTAPLLLQIHHMFWSVPLLVVLPFVWPRERVSSILLGVAFGFIASDLAHHFIVLPLTVGNIGWHWP